MLLELGPVRVSLGPFLGAPALLGPVQLVPGASKVITRFVGGVFCYHHILRVEAIIAYGLLRIVSTCDQSQGTTISLGREDVSELSHVDCNTIELFYSMDQDRHVSVDRVRKTNGPDWFMAVGASIGITAFEHRDCEGCRLHSERATRFAQQAPFGGYERVKGFAGQLAPRVENVT
jgi:hypothetical protein